MECFPIEIAAMIQNYVLDLMRQETRHYMQSVVLCELQSLFGSEEVTDFTEMRTQYDYWRITSWIAVRKGSVKVILMRSGRRVLYTAPSSGRVFDDHEKPMLLVGSYLGTTEHLGELIHVYYRCF